MVTVRPAAAEDWPRVIALLTGAGLPTDDVRPESVGSFSVATDGSGVIGAVAVERRGVHGLLRSLVVDSAWRGQGIGRALVAAAEARAAAAQLDSLTLLTQTAAPLFRTLGYVDGPRDSAPKTVQASAEFAHLCPSSSVCLSKQLKI